MWAEIFVSEYFPSFFSNISNGSIAELIDQQRDVKEVEINSEEGVSNNEEVGVNIIAGLEDQINEEN